MSPRVVKILKRTLVGGSIAAALWLLLAQAEGPDGIRILAPVLALFTLGGALEAARMGPRPPVSLLPILAGTLAGIALVVGPVYCPDCFTCVLELNDGSAPSALIMLGLCAGLVVGVTALASLVSGDSRVAALRANCLRVLWVVPPLLALVGIFSELGRSGLIALIVLSKIGDVAGYYVGSAIGKRHPFPRLSPGKTWAGCVGSLVAGIIASVLCINGGLLPEPHLGVLGAVLIGAIINLASQAGDLLESAFKRHAGVKDSGGLFGPSGGFLDLVDSLLLSAPALLLVQLVLLP
ncbi:MAG: phosphatidate cytidylyltransferase [Planctomycetota bacterium]|nr:phosphatidate cytidylyltransferase [Planctomycetota bacterium]